MRTRNIWITLIPLLAVLVAVLLVAGPVWAVDELVEKVDNNLVLVEEMSNEANVISDDVVFAVKLGLSLAVGGVEGAELSAEANALIKLINNERVKAELKPLVADNMLTVLARLKAFDMMERQYLGHYSPIYGTVEDMLNEAKVDT